MSNWQISDQWSLTSITGYQENHDEFGGDDPVGGYNASNGPVVGFLAFWHATIRYTTEELRIISRRAAHSMLVLLRRLPSAVSRGDLAFVFPGFIFPLAQYITADRQTCQRHSPLVQFTDQWSSCSARAIASEEDEGYNQLIFGQGAYSGHRST